MGAAPSIGEALTRGAEQLARRRGASPRLEAETLLAACLERPRSYLFAWPERTLSGDQWRGFQALLRRRLDGEPLAYILGEREFWSLRLEVGPDVLIPRPETELLVELALERVAAVPAARVLELGTGSGAIAAALASERRNWRITASDASLAALALAQRNFTRLGLANVRPLHGDWYAALPPGERFDLILSNPPYVAEDDPHLKQGDLPWEPRSALVAGADGLDAIRLIGARAREHLIPGGWLLLEHGWDQGPEVRAILRGAGLRRVTGKHDLAGLERVSLGQAPAPEDNP